jgi:hypothetical protein
VSWIGYQKKVCELLLAEDPKAADFSELSDEPSRWKAYRRLVRSRLYQTIDHGFERLDELLGRERFHRLVDRFLAVERPRSIYLRDIPGEFLQFLEGHWESLSREHGLAAYVLDLARYEWAELETAYAYEEGPVPDVVPLEMHRVAVLTPAHRLLDLEYPVHRLGTDREDGALAREPVSLCLYRDSKTHEVEILELTPVAAGLLALIEQQTTPLDDVVRKAADAARLAVDLAFVDALSVLLADLLERGVLLGSLADGTGD